MLSVHVFTHSSLIREEDVAPSRWHERYGVKPIFEDYYALPPMANRALKCIYSRMISKTLQSVLERLQRILHGSSKMAKWMMAFCSVLVLAMCLETLQSSIRMNYNDLYRSGEITKQDSEIRAQARCGGDRQELPVHHDAVPAQVYQLVQLHHGTELGVHGRGRQGRRVCGQSEQAV